MEKQVDLKFPQISRASDMHLMQKVLQEHLFLSEEPHPALLIQSCEIGERRYKPGKSCVMTYHLKILNSETKTTQDQWVCGRLCKPGEGLSEWRRAKDKALFPVAGMHPLVYVSDPEMLVWVFPNDRKLSHLPKMFDLSFLHELFPKQLLSLRLKTSKRLVKIEAHLVHYIPERSCMIRYKLSVEDRASGKIKPVTIYGKVFPDESGRAIYETMRQLSEQMLRGQTAQALGYDPELKALWQSQVPGTPLMAETIKDSACLEIMASIARAVAALHTTKVKDLHPFHQKEVFHLLKKTVDVVRESQPHLIGRVRALVATLLARSEAPGFFTSPLTPIHRDLKLGNMLIHEGKVGLIDMDCVCLGDPLNDVGSFIANFYLNGLYVGCNEAALRVRVDIFCRIYLEEVSWPASQDLLYWYISASFIYEILRRSIRQLSTRRLQYLERYLDLSECYCFHRGKLFIE